MSINMIIRTMVPSLCILPFLGLEAQTLPAEEVQVIKNFEARLADARKLKWNQSLPNFDTVRFSFEYDVLTKILDVEYEPAQIRPISVRPDPLPPTYRGFLQAGYGYPNSPFGKLGYFNKGEHFRFGILGNHQSADHPDDQFQKFSNTNGRLELGYLFERGLNFSGNFGYSVDQFHFYSLPEEQVDSTTVMDHRFNEFNVGLSLNNGSSESDFDFSAEVNYYNIKDNFDVHENGIELNLDGAYWISGSHPLALELNTDFSSLTDTSDRDLLNFHIQPTFTFNSSAVSLQGGIRMYAHDDDYTFYPIINVTAKVLGPEMILFAGAGGEFIKNNFRKISRINPFMSSVLDTVGNSQFSSYHAGLKGLIKNLHYELKLGYKSVENLPLFVEDPEDPKKFELTYDDGRILSAKATVEANILNHLSVIVSGEKLIFDLDSEEEAWHYPTLQANLGLFYHALDGRLKIKTEFFYTAPFAMRSVDGELLESNTLFDVSIGVDYFFTEKFGLFAYGNNLAGTKWTRWYDYPTYGVNAVGGVLVRI